MPKPLLKTEDISEWIGEALREASAEAMPKEAWDLAATISYRQRAQRLREEKRPEVRLAMIRSLRDPEIRDEAARHDVLVEPLSTILWDGKASRELRCEAARTLVALGRMNSLVSSIMSTMATYVPPAQEQHERDQALAAIREEGLAGAWLVIRNPAFPAELRQGLHDFVSAAFDEDPVGLVAPRVAAALRGHADADDTVRDLAEVMRVLQEPGREGRVRQETESRFAAQLNDIVYQVGESGGQAPRLLSEIVRNARMGRWPSLGGLARDIQQEFGRRGMVLFPGLSGETEAALAAASSSAEPEEHRVLCGDADFLLWVREEEDGDLHIELATAAMALDAVRIQIGDSEPVHVSLRANPRNTRRVGSCVLPAPRRRGMHGDVIRLLPPRP